MSHRRLLPPIALVGLVLLANACASQTPVQLDEAPAGTSAEPTPLPAEPELIVGDDGCVTDVATGLVVTCHDPAAGPDAG